MHLLTSGLSTTFIQNSSSFSFHYKSKKSSISIKLIFLLSLLLLLMCYPEFCWSKNPNRQGNQQRSDEKEDTSSAAVGESGEEDGEIEMTEYLDDEVRFVTDDDFLYEEERSQYRDLYQGARGGNNRLSHHLTERCPPLPDPSSVAASGLCDAKKCRRDDECSRDGSLICCEDGCGGHSCLRKVNPPVAFDWVEETDLKFMPSEGSLLPDSRFGASPKTLMDVEVGPELLTLPGGCYLSSKQYDDLIMFRKFDHVKACSCSKGEVSCEINQEQITPNPKG